MTKVAKKTKSSRINRDAGNLPAVLKGFGGGLPRAMGVKITHASKKKITLTVLFIWPPLRSPPLPAGR